MSLSRSCPARIAGDPIELNAAIAVLLGSNVDPSFCRDTPLSISADKTGIGHTGVLSL